MIGGLDANTFMMRLMFGVISFAIAVFICVTCYDTQRKDRLMQAYVRRRAEHSASINQSFVCGSSQTTAAQWLEHGNRNAQLRRQSDPLLQQYRQQMESPAIDPQQVPATAAEPTASQPAKPPALDPGSRGSKSKKKKEKTEPFSRHLKWELLKSATAEQSSGENKKRRPQSAVPQGRSHARNT